MGPEFTDSILKRDRRAESIKRRRPCEDEGRDWNYAATARDTWSHQKLGKTKKNCSLEPSEEYNLDFGLLLSRKTGEQISLF